ncbi:hypothetical protein HAL011_16220 [Helicobacter ailurogastricus]|uniref:Uncharacterized protein n=1 Tax=Helicobacter ailurogastricus TaxID=1578720 RepID=A0A0K2XAU5_9HELI|nr:hypothetical protein HAL011_16220 [Helicobacter ailurogastricus]
MQNLKPKLGIRQGRIRLKGHCHKDNPLGSWAWEVGLGIWLPYFECFSCTHPSGVIS